MAPSDEGAVERKRDWGRDRCFADSLVFIVSPSGALRHLPRQREALVRCITRVRSTATRVYGTIGLYPLVFPAGGEAAPDVPLRLVFVQQRLYLQPQRAVVQRQPFTDVLVDGGLADTEFFGGGPHRRLVLYQVKSQFFGPLLQIFFDSAPLLQAVPLYERSGGKRTENGAFQGSF